MPGNPITLRPHSAGITTQLSAAANAPITAPRHLVSPRLDGWLVGGFGLLAWLVFTALERSGTEIDVIASGPVYWLLLAVSGTHFGVSYHLAYGQGRAAVRRRWRLLVAGPAALAVCSLVVLAMAMAGGGRLTDEAVRLLLVSVYTMTTWHYVKQVYGVARVGSSLAGITLGRTDVLVLRYALYPLWFLDALDVWTGRPAVFGGYDASYDLLPAGATTVLRTVSFVAAAAVVASLFRTAATNRRLPATVWTPYALGFVWLLFPPSYVGVVLVFGALHGLQYLTCAHRAEVAWGVERSPGAPVHWWASVFGAALATGMLLVYWLPRWLTDTTQAATGGATAAALLFAYFNLHHYMVDASIWRYGGEHIKRIVSGPSASGA